MIEAIDGARVGCVIVIDSHDSMNNAFLGDRLAAWAVPSGQEGAHGNVVEGRDLADAQLPPAVVAPANHGAVLQQGE